MYIATKPCACAVAKHDDDDDNKINTLAFVNFLLIKFFPYINIFHHQNFAPYARNTLEIHMHADMHT